MTEIREVSFSRVMNSLPSEQQNVLDGLPDDDVHHGGHIVQTKAAPASIWPFVNAHQAGTDDLGHIGAGVDAQTSAPTSVKLRLDLKTTKPRSSAAQWQECRGSRI